MCKPRTVEAAAGEDMLVLSPLIVIAIRSLLIAVCQTGAVLSSVGPEPVEQSADACAGDCDAVIRAAVVETQRVTIRQDRVPAREDHIGYIANPFVIQLRAHD